ncbi:MAG: hypothetical protein R3D30_00530 [Hyphomicrobiales bacterium]
MKLIGVLSCLRACGLGVLVLCLVPVAGCGVPKISNPFGSSDDSSAASLANDDRLPEMGEVAANQPSSGGLNCPQVVSWPNERLLTIYQPGHDGDQKSVVHRGEFTKLSRECRFFPGQVVVKYGFAGRVLLGPMGKPGTVTMPVHIRAAGANKETLATDKMTITTTIPPGQPVGYFSMVREMSFPIQVGTRPEDYKIFVAFGKARPARNNVIPTYRARLGAAPSRKCLAPLLPNHAATRPSAALRTSSAVSIPPRTISALSGEGGTGSCSELSMRLPQNLRKAAESLQFAMNGGMYEDDLSPVGLHVENGRTLAKVNTVTVKGTPARSRTSTRSRMGCSISGDAQAGVSRPRSIRQAARPASPPSQVRCSLSTAPSIPPSSSSRRT